MAYNSDALSLLTQTIAGGDNHFRLWVYKSTDAADAVDTAGYISNATKKGMKVGDIVLVIDTDASPITAQWMQVNAITNGAADLSDGSAIATTDTD